ncbi:hypothetical protein [Fructobacillus evanidus]|uniref:Uncharacterized protein n=1 Tax=Fructobacillus evanidus TaxID=3064281 RepID=A0ABM9MSR8_9LACO|nr:unnamed protein product [Fructobacillus sp. LMG 32999]CAK1233861.1 unnamed protein product [Fructobacillus sp. LMG 32999]CAK1235837.1 unnamed protein product [Fructobacillus sp. LMG 32999]CAK1236571.1 unnamed protein product [Fructobacillus sp. LMG 32999]CAK1237486.1 unnamed protein product [Fructobacillus sp. LMG 32999]
MTQTWFLNHLTTLVSGRLMTNAKRPSAVPVSAISKTKTPANCLLMVFAAVFPFPFIQLNQGQTVGFCYRC